MRVFPGVAVLAILLSAGGAAAGSQPVVTGKVEGLETCPQSTCGSAQFVGTSQLQVGTIQGKGAFVVQVTHGPVPLLPGGTASITGGQWAASANGSIVTGGVGGGTLVNNGNNTFTVTLTLGVSGGGSGTLGFTGLLDHNTLPPTIVGVLTQ